MFKAYTRMLVLGAAVIVGVPQAARAQDQDQPSQPPAQPQAQSPAQPPAQSQETVTSADVTDEELESFAKSAEEVVGIQQEVEKELAAVTDSAEVQRVKTEANQKMADVIKGHGLEVQRYNLIARSIGADPDLKQRFQQKLQELRQPAA